MAEDDQKQPDSITEASSTKPSSRSGSTPDKKTQKTAEIGVEFGIGPILPGANWADWVGNDGTGLISAKPQGVTIDQVVEMRRRDGQARALIQLLTLPLRLALQSGVFVESDDGDSKAETEFCNRMWSLPPAAGGMTIPASKVVRQMLLSITDGFAPFEIVRQIPEQGPLKGKITLRKLAYRDPRTVKFRVDKQGGYAGFQQVTQDGEGNVVDVTLKPPKTLVITQHDEYNPHYGVSMLESAYPHFDAKRKLYYIAHLAAQFAAVPGRIGKIPHGAKPTEVQAFRQSLINFAFNAAMVVPPDYEVEPFNGSTGFRFLDLIDHHNQQMSKSILAGFFDNDQRTVLIENTTMDASADLFLSNITTIANDIAEAITHYLIPQFIDFNFNSHKYPVFKPGALSEAQKTTINDLFKTVVTAGILNSTPEMVRELEKKVSDELGLSIDYDEIAKREKEAADQKAQMEADQAQAQADALAAAPPGQQPGAAPAAPGGAPAPAGPPDQTALSQVESGIDDLVLAAERLFLGEPDAVPVEDGL